MPFTKGHKIRIGLKHSEVSKDKMRLAKIGIKRPYARSNPQIFKVGHIPWHKNKKNVYTIETLQKMSMNRKGKNVGADNHLWKGGITTENQKIRTGKEHLIWSKKIYEKDNWNCLICSKHCQKGDIVAHHIKFFSTHKELRFEVDNGITLCRSCHLWLHNIYKTDEKLYNLICKIVRWFY